jgi:hypothetical protein
MTTNALLKAVRPFWSRLWDVAKFAVAVETMGARSKKSSHRCTNQITEQASGVLMTAGGDRDA